MRGTWLRILLVFSFVGLIAVGGTYWMMRAAGVGEGVRRTRALIEASEAAEEAKAATTAPPPVINPNRLVIPSSIRPYESVPISAKLTARIERMAVRDGDTVEKGQLICILDDNEIRQEIDMKRAAYLRAQRNLENAKISRANEARKTQMNIDSARDNLESYKLESQITLESKEDDLSRAREELSDYEALYQVKAVSEEELQDKRDAVQEASRALELTRASVAVTLASYERALEQARLDAQTETYSEEEIKSRELDLARARSELAESEARLADTRIVAPIGGTVRFIARTRTSSAVNAGPSSEILGAGVRVYEGDPFLEIAATDCACIVIDVDEQDIDRLYVGMPAKITGDAFEGIELDGEVVSIQSRGESRGTGISRFPVVVRITSPLQGVRMGMTADVTLDLSLRENPTPEEEAENQ